MTAVIPRGRTGQDAAGVYGGRAVSGWAGGGEVGGLPERMRYGQVKLNEAEIGESEKRVIVRERETLLSAEKGTNIDQQSKLKDVLIWTNQFKL